MPLPRFEKLEPTKRARLLEIATAQFAKHGFEGASLNEILAAAGFGKSSYYYYFADKHDLFATVVDAVYHSLEKEIPPANLDVKSAKAFWEAIELQQFAWLKAAVRNPNAMRVIRAAQALRSNGAVNEAVAFRRLSLLMRAMIVAGRARGFIRKDLEVDVLVAVVEAADGALDGALYANEPEPSPARLRAHARLALDTSRRFLRPA